MILHNDQYYHDMLNNFMLQDLKTCNYDYYQHNINFYNHVKNLISSVKVSMIYQMIIIFP